MERLGITGSKLKYIAMISMLIDHIAAAILARILVAGGVQGIAQTPAAALLPEALSNYSTLLATYKVMRAIGRIAFPIYCFLLVEGYVHTRDPKKYALRLGIFALISEVPFDLAFESALLETSHQNVFFTLLLGLLAMMGIDYGATHGKTAVAKMIIELAAAGVCMGAAELLRTDYAARGVFCIIVLYLYRNTRLIQTAAGILAFFWWELAAVFAFIPIYLYNGKRGAGARYVFYVFYPAHLLIIYLVCRATGIAGIVPF
jgi:hypothetical protein